MSEAVSQTQDSAKQIEDVRPLDEVNLGIGDTLQLQSQDEFKSRYYVNLVGYLKGKSVIVTTPTSDGKVMLIREGQGFVVRMFSGKSVYAYVATVFKVLNTPYPHLHLTYPNEVRGLVIRKKVRAKVNLIAAVKNSHGAAAAASVVNISTGGALVLSKAALGEKDENIDISVRVQVNETDQTITVPAVIKSVFKGAAVEGEPAMYNHGVQFVHEGSDTALMTLTAFVYQRLFEESAEA